MAKETIYSGIKKGYGGTILTQEETNELERMAFWYNDPPGKKCKCGVVNPPTCQTCGACVVCHTNADDTCMRCHVAIN
jgi:hypothetical protein